MRTVRRPDQWCGPCPMCGAVGWEEWPHPEGQPCPLKEQVDRAYIEKLEAERAYYERASFSTMDMSDLANQLSKILPADE